METKKLFLLFILIVSLVIFALSLVGIIIVNSFEIPINQINLIFKENPWFVVVFLISYGISTIFYQKGLK
jgi:presenilin-like A22 family membrane protease